MPSNPYYQRTCEKCDHDFKTTDLFAECPKCGYDVTKSTPLFKNYEEFKELMKWQG